MDYFCRARIGLESEENMKELCVFPRYQINWNRKSQPIAIILCTKIEIYQLRSLRIRIVRTQQILLAYPSIGDDKK